MATKFGENLSWFLHDVSCGDRDSIDGVDVDIYGETAEGADCSASVDLRELCGAAHERIAELEAQSQWIPVSEPPTTTIGTGTYGTATVIVYDGNDVFEAEYTEGNTVYHWAKFDVDDGVTVTHWMPLPEPPTGEGTEGSEVCACDNSEPIEVWMCGNCDKYLVITAD